MRYTFIFLLLLSGCLGTNRPKNWAVDRGERVWWQASTVTSSVATPTSAATWMVNTQDCPKYFLSPPTTEPQEDLLDPVNPDNTL